MFTHTGGTFPELRGNLRGRVRRQLRPFRGGRLQHTHGGSCERTKAFLEEFLRCSSIHGLGHLARGDKHWSEYFLWILVLSAAVTGMGYMGLKAWWRYQYYPTVISMEKDYMNWNTTYATATICPEIRTDEAKLRNIAERYNVRNVEEFVKFFEVLARVSYADFGDLPDYREVDPEDYLSVLSEGRFNFSFLLSNGQNVVLGSELMTTEIGLCNSVNSDVGVYFAVRNINRSLPVRRDNENLLTGNPLDGEIVVQVMNMNCGYNLSITGPFDIPDLSVRRTYSRMLNFLSIDLTVLPIISSEGLRNLSPEQRRCRFFDESELDVSDVYSYNICRMQCRADLAFHFCKCIPYFYRTKERRPYCDINGMKCLGKHGRYLTDLRDPATNGKIQCNCLPLCNDYHYLIAEEHNADWPRRTHFKYGMYLFPRTRLKREVMFGIGDFLGSAGLLLGCSVLSFIEIVYFATFRLFFFLRSVLDRQRHAERSGDDVINEIGLHLGAVAPITVTKPGRKRETVGGDRKGRRRKSLWGKRLGAKTNGEDRCVRVYGDDGGIQGAGKASEKFREAVH